MQLDDTISDLNFTNDWFSTLAAPTWKHLFKNVKPKNYLEIGVFEGQSACWVIRQMIDGAYTKGSRLTLIDNWRGSREHGPGGIVESDLSEVKCRFDENLQKVLSSTVIKPKIEVINSSSLLALSSLIQNRRVFDFIYIDGSHHSSDVLTDACLAFPMLTPKGIMIFDDYLWKLTGETTDNPLTAPKIAIDAFTTIFGQNIRIISAPLYQIVIQKL